MNDAVAHKIRSFFEQYPQRHATKGQVLVQSGDNLPGVFYLLEGSVRQYDIADSGEEIVVNVFKPTSFFPMSWAINHTPNQYFFEAASDVSFHLAPAGEVVRFLQENSDVLFDLLARVYSGVDGLLRRMAHLMGGNARTRLMFELLNQVQRFGKVQPDGSYLLEQSEAELATRSGLARETISRELRDLHGIVEVSRRGIKIPDLSRLEDELGTTL